MTLPTTALVATAAAGVSMLAPWSAPRAQSPAPDTVIGFDEPGLAGQMLTGQYSQRGVTFVAAGSRYPGGHQRPGSLLAAPGRPGAPVLGTAGHHSER